MAAEEINLETVEEYIEEYQEVNHSVPVESDTITVPVTEFDNLVQYAHEGYVGGGYAWVVRHPEDTSELSETTRAAVDDRKRVLLVLPRDSDEWGIPGGGREGKEAYEDATRREVMEEVGIDCQLTGLWKLEHLHWESEDATDKRTTHSLHVFFEARYVSGNITIQSAEMNGAAWFAELPERLGSSIERRAETWRSQ